MESLPPLTDDDFREIYQDLITYVDAPLSPTQLRLEQTKTSKGQLALSDASAPFKLSPRSRRTAYERIHDLKQRLQGRLPDKTLTHLETEHDKENLLSQLLRARSVAAAASKSNSASPSPPGPGLPTLKLSPSILETESETRSKLSESPLRHTLSQTSDRQLPAEQGEACSSSYRNAPMVDERNRMSQNTSRTTLQPTQSASERHWVLLMLGELLPALETPSNGSRHRSKVSQIQVGIATSQEWAALVLGSASDSDLADLLTTLELMQVRRQSLSQISEEIQYKYLPGAPSAPQLP